MLSMASGQWAGNLYLSKHFRNETAQQKTAMARCIIIPVYTYLNLGDDI